jgi:hypothetical protein
MSAEQELETQEDQTEVNPLDMSDEDFLASPPYEEPVEQEESSTNEEDDAPNPEDETQAEEDTYEDSSETQAEESKPDTQEEEATDQIDYKAAYEQILKPFKANGKEVQVQSVEDAISLMQMGANYNKKMAGLKPNLKVLKLLESNNLLDESKLNFLIDLDKRNPDAITKLIKDSGIDPFDLNEEKANTYQPTNRAIDDQTLELDLVLEELKETPTYSRTLEVVGKSWDNQSRNVLATQPQLIKVINDHVASGIYDIISTEVEREKMFGRLNGLSDIDAYRKIGDAIQARGGFNHIGNQQPAAPIKVQPKPKADDAQLKEKRRAASSTPAAPKAAVKSEFNPLSMSDEEFNKMSASQFI